MNDRSFLGPYDRLYASRKGSLLWQSCPGRLVATIGSYVPNGRVLDIGCGDGKNALYLEQHGYAVHGVDVSRLALNGLYSRFAAAGREPMGTYEISDIHCLELSRGYDAVVSYGLFHCLRPGLRVAVHQLLQQNIRANGVLLFSSLSNDIPMPDNHGTGRVQLPCRDELNELFRGWRIEHFEAGLIQEDHLPLIGNHKHSAIWIIARKG